jgi:arabinofuranosyltransferase
MVLTRLDTSLFLASSATVVFLEQCAGRTPWRDAARGLRGRFAAPIIFLPLYLAWKISYYGRLMPNTYYAKAADIPHWSAGVGYLQAYLDGSPYVLVLLPFAFYMAAAENGGRAKSFARFAMLGLTGYLLYVARVGGDFMQYRFMFEVYPVLLWSAAAGIAYLATASIAATLPAGLLAVALTRHEEVLEETNHMETPEDMDGCCGRPLVRLGKRFAEVLPRDTVIATTAAGSIPYFTQLTTIDQYALNDRVTASQSPDPDGFRRGHVKSSRPEYLLARGVNLVIGLPETCSCDDPCVETDLADVFIRIEGDECVRAWYATPREDLSRFFCRDAADFVMANFDCSPFLGAP